MKETTPRRAYWALLLLVSVFGSDAYAQPMPPVLCIDTTTDCQPAVEPTPGSYPHYPALNLNDIPWHTAAGGWGPQVQILAPATPVISSEVTVTTAAQFNSARAANRRIIIDGSWTTDVSIGEGSNSSTDVEIVILPGRSIGAITIGQWPWAVTSARIRITGGGRMGQLRTNGVTNDLIVDGVDINGASSFGGGETNQGVRAGNGERWAILNSRIIAPGYAWLGSARHVVIANTNIYHGAAARSTVGFVEGWGIRNTGGPITIIDSRIQGTRYHNIRAQSVGGTGELLYIARSTLVAVAEGRTAWMWNNLNNGPWFGQGAVIEDSEIYTYAAPGCGFGAEISAANVDWSRIRNNRFYGGGTAVFSPSAVESAAVGGGGAEGNTFSSLGALPPWGGPGDPTQVPLPAGLTLISAEGQCPAFQ